MFLLSQNDNNTIFYETEKRSKGMKMMASLLLAVIVIMLMAPYIACADIYGRADMTYQKTTRAAGGKSTETSSLNQGYTLGFNKDLTSTIMVSGDVRLTENDIDGKHTEDIYPLFYLKYTPPSMYYVSLSYNRNESIPPGGDRITTSYTNVSFVLPLENWPSLSLFYNRSTTNDYLDPHKVNNVYTNMGLNTGYNFSFLDTATSLNYSYSDIVTKDNVTETKQETPNHTASAGLSRAFWDKKIQTNVNIGYSQSENINESLGAPTRFEQETAAADGLYLLDATPLVGALTSTPALIDNNTGASAGIDPLDTGAYRNIGIRFSIAEAVHKLHLYLSTTDPNIATYNFGWQLYTSSDGTNWTLFSGTLTTSYESAYQRIVFTFAETSALYFKVVNTLFPVAALPINVTELEAIGFVSSTPTLRLTYTTKRDFGGFNFSFSPITRLTMNYNINYDNSSQDLNDIDISTVAQGAGLNSIIVPQYLIFATNYSTSRTTSSQKPSGITTTTETGIDSYMLSLSSSPLPTVNASLNYGHTESLTGGETYSKSDSMNGNVFMNLYKGVDLGLGSSIVESKDLKANSKTESINNTANLNLIPWRPLTIIVNGGLSSSSTETAGVETHSTGKMLNTTLSYTPTRSLYFSALIAIEPITSQSYSVTWLPTRTIQASVRYGLSGEITNMGGDLSWAPIPRLNLRVGYTTTKTDNITKDHTDSLFATASLRL